jgi:DNA invertase Pin-like site-specific DNA recombinase
MSKPRAVIYKRQSSFKEESISLELQERACRDYAVGQGYEVVAVEEDPGISGRTWNRPGVQRVMEMVEAKQADVIVLWKWSRWSRSRLDWAVAADKVETFGGRIESATEQVDVSTSTGRLARGMLTEFAAFESERIGDTWKETHARRIRNGLPHHGLPRFGYTYTKQGGYVPDEASGPVLRELYRRFIAGSTLKELGAYAASEGFEPETGWREGTLRRILDRGFGAGYVWSKGEHVQGAHEPVISGAEWVQYRARRDSRGGRPRAETSDYAFSGLLRCHCGGNMAGGRISHANGRHYPRYICIIAQQKHTHKQSSVSEPYVEKVVLAWLSQIALEIDAKASTLEIPRATGIGRKQSQYAAELSKNQLRLDSLTLKYLDGEVSKEVYERLKEKLGGDKSATEARLRLVEANSMSKPGQIVPQTLENWHILPARGKRELLSRLISHIELHERENGALTGKRRITVHAVWE